ncbi:MAG TPA: DinB family protein [Terriglobales bacterium]|nr:DinB family protein [Terriglobales bacterium]
MTLAVRMKRPEPAEHAEYYSRYVNLVPEGDIVATLYEQMKRFAAYLRTIPESKGDHRYGADKWSIKEMLGHVNDGERIFAYRALRFARADENPLPGFEQDDYVRVAGHGRCSMADLIEEFELLRKANILMFKQLDEAAWKRVGTASGNKVSVRALAFILAGHVEHHIKMLKEKYGV